MTRTTLPSIDDRFLQIFRRARIPMLGTGLTVAVVFSFVTEWALAGPAIGALTLALGHAIYERFRPSSNPAFGLAVDIPLGIEAARLSGSHAVIVGLAMLLAVLATFHAASTRVVLLALVTVTSSVALLRLQDDPIDTALSITTLIAFGAMATFVVAAAVDALRRSEIERSYAMGTVTHELRNDLTGVLGLAQILAEDARANGLEEMADMAELIAREGMDASATIDDLLTLTKIDNDHLDLRRERIDLRAVAGDTVDRVGLEGRVEITGGSAFAVGDEQRLRQILRNLLTNADRYGGPTISITVLEGEGEAGIDVVDDGEGVPPEHVETIFEPFGRSANARNNDRSVGLGLWLSRELAQAMGGNLEYRRFADRTSFELRLPADTSAGPPESVGTHRLTS